MRSDLPEFPSAPEEAGTMEPFAGVDIPEVPAPDMPELESEGPTRGLALPEAPAPEEREFTGEVPAPEFREEEPATAGHELEPVTERQVFERAVESREPMRRVPGPMFVSVDDYRTIMEHSERVRAKLADAEQFVHRLGEIKAEEEKVFDKWRGHLEDVERKLAQVDRVIAKAKR
jgi:hypothetical protein